MIYKDFGKRLFDVICSLSGLVILSPLFIFLSPLFILISVLIKIGSPGPIFFFQERMGRGGDKFQLIKFRSMHINPTQEKRGFNPGDDARVTRLGKFIRKTKIDELPELLNVLRGNMSIRAQREHVYHWPQARGRKICTGVS
jgi:lipopolysaccharide/colanic/teichoic acid biosynthesis glycosyltransferase